MSTTAPLSPASSTLNGQKVDACGRPLWLVTRRFTGGLLVGLTHTGETPVSMRVGLKVPLPCGGSPYEIIECRPAVD